MNYINEQIQETQKYLPNIRPLKEFVHLNLYHKQQHKFFWQAIEDISLKYSILVLPPLKYYQDLYAKGSINGEILQSHIKSQVIATGLSAEELQNDLFKTPSSVHLPEKTYRPINKHINEKIDCSLKEITEPVLIRFLSGFFDQGLSNWSMPFKDLGLLECFKELILKSYLSIYPIKKELIQKVKHLNGVQIIDLILSDMFNDLTLRKLYIEESILSLKGWSSFIISVQHNPSLIRGENNISIEDYLALRLLIERSWIENIGHSTQQLQLNSLDPKKLVKQQIIDRKSWISYKIWQESLENTYHFDQLKQLQKQMFKFKEALDFEDSYQIQSIFCIDDREILFRSNLENQNASIQTFGTPGHFGLDINYYEGVSANPQKLCPPPVEAKHKIVSIKGSKRVNNFFKWFSKKNNTRSMKFEVLHSNFNSDFGFSHEAAAEKLSIIFKSIGLKTFAPLIYIIGHESTTSNNPYFNAYGCGACSGRSGAINATVFARLANDKKVQEILASKYNIKIPVFSHFVAAVHNTTSEVLHFFDAQLIPTDQKVLHDSFLSASQLALKKNSIVRAQDFALIRKSSLKMDYFNELRSRSKSFFEPRPELGHTGNLMCVVGRRQMTKGLNFDRRAFVQSYNYDDDQDGAILNSILGAAVPVCGGINLDYFFSSINSDNIGAGSKLSHNVVGLSGLSHGTEDDLLPGLAEQMVELHQPIRMLFVIEQKLEVVKSLMQKNSDLNSWVTKGWIKLACFCPEAKSCFYFDSGSFQKFDEVLGFAENVDVCGVPSV